MLERENQAENANRFAGNQRKIRNIIDRPNSSYGVLKNANLLGSVISRQGEF